MTNLTQIPGFSLHSELSNVVLRFVFRNHVSSNSKYREQLAEQIREQEIEEEKAKQFVAQPAHLEVSVCN